MISVRKSFPTKLSLGILLLAVPIFWVSLGLLFYQSRNMIREEAVGRAHAALHTTMQRINRKVAMVEMATRANDWLVVQDMRPEALLGLTHRIVALNSHIDGCSVSLEPGMLPEYGRYFSAYSVREGDTVATVIEEQYEYFEKKWYKTPRYLGKPCWVEYFDETDSLNLTLAGMIASYNEPLYDADGSFVAVISTDISLLRFSKAISENKPYPHSYFILLDDEGRYLIHPDTARLFRQSIFSGTEPHKHADLIALGHEMTKGGHGNMSVVVDGVASVVCYEPVAGTDWSLALICPESDVLEGYHRLTYIVVSLLIVGLIVILFLCKRAVAHAIRPLHELLAKTQTIAAGNMEVHISRSQREDVVGRLQNSFAIMLQSINFHMGSIRYVAEQARKRNEELVLATRMAREAERQKSLFIQNVSHQIRTPLNIIMGFAQVLSETGDSPLPEEEMKGIMSAMEHNSQLLNRLVAMLFDSSDTGLSEELLASTKHNSVPCNEVAREAVSYIKLHYPKLNVGIQTSVPDSFCMQTSRMYLMRSLREILYNSAKYSDGQHVMLYVEAMPAGEGQTPTAVRFIVEDTGKGIAEADRELMFKFFAKVDDLSEGLGLGLPLAKRHARNLGGDLTLDVDYHDGCRFILELPILN